MAHQQYTAIEVADWFLRKVNRPSGDSINQLKLQVLLYFSEAWSLAAFDRELFDEEIQGWEHGPVVYSVWDRLSMHGWTAELEKMVHKDAPWKEARHGLPPWDLTKRPINKTTMTHTYKAQFEADARQDGHGELHRPLKEAHPS